MSEIYRYLLKVSLALLITSVISVSGRAAGTICKDLPPSKLVLYDVKAPRLDEEKVPAANLDRRTPPDPLASQHTMMRTMSNVISWFDIRHRSVPRGDGSVCDAPEFVRIGFGSSQRKIFFADAVADDVCVRRRMLDHEADHTRAFDSTVDRFLDDRKADFERGMKALKQTPAPNLEVATARWDQGLRIIVTEANRQLMADLRAASAGVDDPAALTALEVACDGQIRKLESRGSASSANP